jgi:hypothetical protein
MAASTILGRIASRTGVALWRNRFAWLTCLVVLAGLGLYQLGFAGAATPSPSSTTDCADTTMQAVSRVDDSVARAAYDCMGPTMRQGDEQEFVQALHARGDMPSGHVDRVGDKRQSDGSRIVFYTVEAGGTAVGYIVYLDSNGKVEKIE